MENLSIIVPIYNVEKYLPTCLDSILAQTFKDFELILVNDGSTDNSKNICFDYANKDERIKVINKENGGVSSARNVGLNLSKGKLISFVDPDDLLEPNMYEKLINALYENNVDISVSRIKTLNHNSNSTSISLIWGKAGLTIDRDDIEKKLIPSIILNNTYSLVPVFNKVYKRRIFDNFGIQFDETMHFAEDLRFNLNILTKIGSLVYVDQPLYNYFIHKRESAIQQFRKDMYDYILNNKQYLLQLCLDYGVEDYSTDVNVHFMNVTLNYIDDVAKSKITKREKFYILNKILNDFDFRGDLLVYNCPTLYRVVVKYLCILRIKRILIIFIKCKIRLQIITRIGLHNVL